MEINAEDESKHAAESISVEKFEVKFEIKAASSHQASPKSVIVIILQKPIQMRGEEPDFGL